jgi:hypothetical protein
MSIISAQADGLNLSVQKTPSAGASAGGGGTAAYDGPGLTAPLDAALDLFVPEAG